MRRVPCLVLRRYLVLPPMSDAPRSTALLSLKQVDEALARLRPPSADIGAGCCVDPLILVRPDPHAVAGTWEISDKKCPRASDITEEVAILPQGRWREPGPFPRVKSAVVPAACCPPTRGLGCDSGYGRTQGRHP